MSSLSSYTERLGAFFGDKTRKPKCHDASNERLDGTRERFPGPTPSRAAIRHRYREGEGEEEDGEVGEKDEVEEEEMLSTALSMAAREPPLPRRRPRSPSRRPAPASAPPRPPVQPLTTLAEKLAGSSLRQVFTVGLRWWLPLSRLEGFTGVAEAAGRLWENTVLLSGLMCSLSGYAVLFPVERVVASDWGLCYSTLWALAFAFTLTAAVTSTILLNKICKCAPQNLSLWFKRFGGFVELPLIFLYVGTAAFSAGILVVLIPLYGNCIQVSGLVLVFSCCGVLIGSVYSDTTDFEKSCTKAAERFPSSAGAAEGAIMSDYARRKGVQTTAADWEYDGGAVYTDASLPKYR